MIHKHNHFSRIFPSSLHRSLESIEVIGEGREWLKNLPFEGEIEEGSRITDEETKSPIQMKPKKTRKINKQQMKIQVKKCLYINKKLNAQLSEFLSLIKEGAIINSKIATNSYNAQDNTATLISGVKESKTESNFDESLDYPLTTIISKGESSIVKPNIVTVYNSIISHASKFNLYYQDFDQFVISLEKYKKEVKKFLNRSSEHNVKFKKFKTRLQLCKVQNKTSLRSYSGSAENKCWNALKSYFVSLSSDIVNSFQELGTSPIDTINFPFLDIKAVNRLSAILRALIYCSSRNISYDIFKVYITNHPHEYAKERNPTKTYPNLSELEYLMSLESNKLFAEIGKLCATLLEERNLLNKQEETLEMEIKRMRKRNDELKKTVTEAILNKAIIGKRMENRDLLDSYKTYIQTYKKKKEEIDNCCSTEYSDKRTVIT